ncbi:ATP-dependent helicase [Nitrosospira sp. NRS527]|uniref:UvrD-helicase domain-containing protein n=1 Tax=Nitrosospira sp. NRS527 TaxID=155925 RepID=UPI001AF04851|nr:ATP-dependent helicase [Nitrosospira sp. NRS527]BCT68775.1 Putative ATP-dependent DNA helicase YjcD [Nitrosospira sp. NRS527]
MEFILTKEQEAIIGADLTPQCVIACPGSGKTATAVRRLVEIRRRLGDGRGYIALFSYSNIAVETFRREYRALTRTMPGLSPRVLIETVDSFLTTYVLRPHAARTMGASRQPFLVQGAEPFLNGFKIFDGMYPHDITELRVKFKDNGSLECALHAPGKQSVPIEEWKAIQAIEKLGKAGSYTHELARYWAIRTLIENDRLYKAVCRRYPYILVDEAQDIGPLHGHLISILIQGGTSVSLIGDPNQGIYDFAGADGRFLRQYSMTSGIRTFPLSQNRRSVSSIIEVADRLAGTKTTPFREPADRKHGAFYLRYDETDLDALMTTFVAILEANKYAPHEAVVVCRGNSSIDKLAGGGSDVGRGATGYFARAAVLRDCSGDIATAFEHAVSAILRLLNSPPDVLRRDLLSTTAEGDTKTLRRILWGFLRSPAAGIPDSKLAARSKWHPTLKKRVRIFLASIEAKTSYLRSANWANNVTVTGLSDAPLWQDDLGRKDSSAIRVDTVHKVKGEGIPVVLYLAQTSDINKLLQGATSEEGRIGYVAVTRARDLLLLGVPKTAKKPVLNGIEARGFKLWTA